MPHPWVPAVPITRKSFSVGMPPRWMMKSVLVEAPLRLLVRRTAPLLQASLLSTTFWSLAIVRAPPTVSAPCRLVAPLAVRVVACTAPLMFPVDVRPAHCTPLARSVPPTLTVEENVAAPLAPSVVACTAPLMVPVLLSPATVVAPVTDRDPPRVAAPEAASVLAWTGPEIAPTALTVPPKEAAPLTEKVPATVSCWAGAAVPTLTPTLPLPHTLTPSTPKSPILARLEALPDAAYTK